MRVLYHPDFPDQIKRFDRQYRKISDRLAFRFREDVDKALDQIKQAPTSAGHLLKVNSQIINDVRRRNLVHFLFCTASRRERWFFVP